MSENKRKKGLGRGLSSLLNESSTASSSKPEATIAIDLILPNPDQPRRTFLPKEMEELTDSVRRNGILQPLLWFGNVVHQTLNVLCNDTFSFQ